MTRSGLSQEEVQRIMAAQAKRAERLAAADDILTNDGDISGLAAQVAVLHQKYMSFTAKIPQTG
jgi:dephospho-CoA kinase